MAPNEPTPASGPGPAVDPATGGARDLEAQVLAQAVQDPAFRARLLADPKAVFADLGLSIPPEIRIQVLQGNSGAVLLGAAGCGGAPCGGQPVGRGPGTRRRGCCYDV